MIYPLFKIVYKFKDIDMFNNNYLSLNKNFYF